MIEMIFIFLMTPLAAIGVVKLGEITGTYAIEKELKRKEQFKKDVLEIIKEVKEEEK